MSNGFGIAFGVVMFLDKRKLNCADFCNKSSFDVTGPNWGCKFENSGVFEPVDRGGDGKRSSRRLSSMSPRFCS